jgi:hypothetical protein
MKFVKFGALALSFGLFFASCGGNDTTNETEETVIEETTVAPVMEEPIAPIEGDTVVTPEEAPVEPVPAP